MICVARKFSLDDWIIEKPPERHPNSASDISPTKTTTLTPRLQVELWGQDSQPCETRARFTKIAPRCAAAAPSWLTFVCPAQEVVFVFPSVVHATPGVFRAALGFS